MAVAFDEAGHDVQSMLLRQSAEVIGRRSWNALCAIGVARTDASVGQRFAEHDQVGFLARGLLDVRCELAAGIHWRSRATRTVMHGSETDLARRRRFGWKEGNVAPLDLAIRSPQQVQLNAR